MPSEVAVVQIHRAQQPRRTLVMVVVAMLAVTLLSAAPKFTSVWRSPEAKSVSFAGKKVAGLVITQDESLRVSGEETLVRELAARGVSAVAAYRIVPKEELQNADRARGWFERANIEGIVAMRPVSKDKRTTYNPGIWVNPNYSSLWGYYGYGWGSVYVPGSVDRDTIVVVEITVYSVPANTLVWAAVSETRNPKALPRFVDELVTASVKELHKQGLAGGIAK